jgi:hypothetical protein
MAWRDWLNLGILFAATYALLFLLALGAVSGVQAWLQRERKE